jgi:hypothetical protein
MNAEMSDVRLLSREHSNNTVSIEAEQKAVSRKQNALPISRQNQNVIESP